MELKRGIILGASFKNGTLNYGLDLEVVYQALLFWDIIDYTHVWETSWNGGESQCVCPELDYLQQLGIATKGEEASHQDKVLISGKSGWDISEIILLEQYATLVNRSKQSDIIWSTFNDIGNANMNVRSDDIRGSIEIELYQAIQTPIKNIPIDDVLEFRASRKDELLSLRYFMDELASEISTTEDFQKRKLITLERLHKQIADYNQVFNETGFQSVKRSLSVIATDPIISVSSVVGVMGSIIAPTMAPAFTQLTGASIGVAAIKCIYKEIFLPKEMPQNLGHLSYISKMNHELV